MSGGGGAVDAREGQRHDGHLARRRRVLQQEAHLLRAAHAAELEVRGDHRRSDYLERDHDRLRGAADGHWRDRPIPGLVHVPRG